MILAAHGMRIELPGGWSGRLFSRSPHTATLHAGDFQLPLDDGEFGDLSTSVMPGVGSFVAVTEYRPGAGLKPGAGLFAPRGLRLPLDPAEFAANRLAHPHPGQAGTQQFFTSSGRPLCLYVVVAGPRTVRRRQLLALDHVLGSLRIEPPA
ncbi:MAG: hypothetical protein JO168_05880 [Solirubrobacterales bacterium]|nr:hypothetical protein [Solirubrobacterales bacterium]MBV9717020.1 hypothetical protein [Solirubrobacterales bacterium]